MFMCIEASLFKIMGKTSCNGYFHHISVVHRPFCKKGVANENLIIKGQQESLKLAALICTDAEEIGIVMVQNLINGAESAIMHVGLCIAKVSQAGYLEPEEVADISGNNIPS